MKFKVGDRVKITVGNYTGIIGFIYNTDRSEYPCVAFQAQFINQAGCGSCAFHYSHLVLDKEYNIQRILEAIDGDLLNLDKIDGKLHKS